MVPTSTCLQVGQLGAKMGLRWPTWSAKLTNLAPRCLQDRPSWTQDGAKLANLDGKMRQVGAKMTPVFYDVFLQIRLQIRVA